MPSALLHLLVLEQLPRATPALPEEFARALTEDLEYARLGALFAELPRFEGFRGGLEAWRPSAEVPYFTQLLRERAPLQVGFQLAELVAAGALVGREPGLALVAGYFSHCALDAALRPVVADLARRCHRPGEEVAEAYQRIEWLQALFYAQETLGESALRGRPLRERFQITKSGGLPRGIGRGIYEILRLSCEEWLHEAPTKAQVDGWARGLFLYAWMLSSPVAYARVVRPFRALSRRELYCGADVNLPELLASTLARTSEALGQLSLYMQRGTFTQRSRARLLSNFPLRPNGVPGPEAAAAGARAP